MPDLEFDWTSAAKDASVKYRSPGEDAWIKALMTFDLNSHGTELWGSLAVKTAHPNSYYVHRAGGEIFNKYYGAAAFKLIGNGISLIRIDPAGKVDVNAWGKLDGPYRNCVFRVL